MSNILSNSACLSCTHFARTLSNEPTDDPATPSSMSPPDCIRPVELAEPWSDLRLALMAVDASPHARETRLLTDLDDSCTFCGASFASVVVEIIQSKIQVV